MNETELVDGIAILDETELVDGTAIVDETEIVDETARWLEQQCWMKHKCRMEQILDGTAIEEEKYFNSIYNQNT